MAKFLLSFLFFVVSFCGSAFAQADKQEQREHDNPKTYLRIYNCERYVPLVGKTEYYFDIQNAGLIVTYYEITVKISFKNKNHTVIGEEYHTLKGYLDPQTYKRFPVKSSEPNPFSWSSWSYELINANSGGDENIQRGNLNDLEEGRY